MLNLPASVSYLQSPIWISPCHGGLAETRREERLKITADSQRLLLPLSRGESPAPAPPSSMSCVSPMTWPGRSRVRGWAGRGRTRSGRWSCLLLLVHSHPSALPLCSPTLNRLSFYCLSPSLGSLTCSNTCSHTLFCMRWNFFPPFIYSQKNCS